MCPEFFQFSAFQELEHSPPPLGRAGPGRAGPGRAGPAQWRRELLWFPPCMVSLPQSASLAKKQSGRIRPAAVVTMLSVDVFLRLVAGYIKADARVGWMGR